VVCLACLLHPTAEKFPARGQLFTLARRPVVECEIMASRSVNKVILIGHLGRDAETKFTPSGVPVSKFAVATNRRWKDQQTGEWKEETEWTNVVLWRQENLANYLTKGKQIYVEGRLQTRTYDDKDGKKMYYTEVVADEVILLSGRGAEGGSAEDDYSQMASMPRSAQQRTRPAAAPSASPEPSTDLSITDDDVPF
jgi:single-strand DNA-binding protein